jgi:type I restriction-modification system DNA methylase subunit
MIRTKRNIQFIESLLSVFVEWEHDGKDYIEYLRTAKGGDEFDMRDWFVKPIFEKLGYEKGDFNHEHPLFSGKPDFFIKPTMFPPLITVETKPSSAAQKDFLEARTSQLFPAMKELRTPTGVLANGVRFELYHQVGKIYQRVVELDFGGLVIAYKKKGIDGISNEHFEKLIKLLWLKKSNQAIKDEDFYPPPEVNISEPTQFEMLLDDLAAVVEMVKIDVEERFDILMREYEDYEERARHLQGYELKQLQKEKRDAIRLQNLCEKWSQINDIALKENRGGKEKFITETMYILVNRVLLIRIAEDKGIIKRRISNGAIRDYKQYVKEIRVNYTKLLDEGYRTIESVYEHLFRRDIFDWYNPDSELLMKVLFTFNRYNFAEVNRDILGNLYQKYIDKEERKRLGQFYTPHEVIDYILDSVGYSAQKEIENKILLDPACGSGGFLVPAVNRLVARLREKNYDAVTILGKVKENIYGFDINPFAAHLTETNLLFQVIDLIGEAKGQNPSFKMEKFNVYVTDTLKIPIAPLEGTVQDFFTDAVEESAAAEDVEVVKEIKLRRGKFSNGVDLVVGNPPWGIKFETSTRDELMRRFEHIHVRTPESSNYFIGIGIDMLKPDGLLGMIVPNNLLYQHEFHKTRGFLLTLNRVMKVVNIGDSVFEDVITPSCIITVQKDGQDCLDNKVLIKDMRRIERDKLRETFRSDKNFQQIDQRSIFEIKDHVFQSDVETSELLKKSFLHKHTLGQIADEVAAGIGTGGDSIFRISIAQADTLKLEKEPLKPVLVGREISDYYTPDGSDHVIIYTTKNFDIKRNPKVFEYLKPFQEKLSQKRETRKGLIPWYSLHWPRYPDLFKAPKIICRQTADTLIASIDHLGYYVLNSIIIIRLKDGSGYDLKYVLALLNSTLLRYVYRRLTQEEERVFAEVKPVNLRKLPIAKANQREQSAIAKLAEKMTRKTKELAETEKMINEIVLISERPESEGNVSLADSSFLSYINIEEHLGKTKIERKCKRIHLSRNNFIDLSDEKVAQYVERSLKGMVDRLRGMTKAELLRTVRIPRTLKGVEAVLKQVEQLVDNKKKLEKEKVRLNKEIDQKVFELYELTGEEIKIVEVI